MYEIALTVSACLRAGTRVHVAWAVGAEGLGWPDKGEALAITPGGGRVGSLLSGSLDDQLADLSDQGVPGRAVALRIHDWQAELAGLPRGGDVRCLLLPATEMPAALWDRLRDRDPVCLVTRLDGNQVAEIALYGPDTVADAGEEAARLFARGVSDSLVTPDTVTTVLWPVAKLVIIGAGPIADALRDVAGVLGWHTQIVTRAALATGTIAGLAALDKVVVIAHDEDLAGAALAAALAGPVGYIGATGSRRMQQSRADWLAYRGITDLARIHGPAGLDIGAKTPAEIAISVVAEALAVTSGAGAGPLRDRPAPVR